MSDEALFENIFMAKLIMSRPGMMKTIYETPSRLLILLPSAAPKILI
jgi:hypothetical protein